MIFKKQSKYIVSVHSCTGQALFQVNGASENLKLMKKLSIVVIHLFLLGSLLYAQNTMEEVLEEIESNHTGLKAFRKQMDARELLNKTDIYLQNPEFEFGWFSGSPEDLGSKTTISLRQQVDFPTAYIHKRRIARARNKQLQPEYDNLRREVMLDAHLVCLELIYYNALAIEYDKRLLHAQGIADAYSRMMDAGETQKIELNKARLNLLDMEKDARRIQIERDELQDRLTTMNGGVEIHLSDTVFEEVTLIEDFETWFLQVEHNNPEIQGLMQEVEISRKQEKLQRALNLPSFSAGYASEKLSHEQFQGIVVGVTIPLWENKNTLKYAKARTLALQGMEQDRKLQYYNQMKTMHLKATNLLVAVLEYQRILQTLDNAELLSRAREEGEISLTNYLLELSYYYDSVDNLWEMKLDLYQTLAKLDQYVN